MSFRPSPSYSSPCTLAPARWCITVLLLRPSSSTVKKKKVFLCFSSVDAVRARARCASLLQPSRPFVVVVVVYLPSSYSAASPAMYFLSFVVSFLPSQPSSPMALTSRCAVAYTSSRFARPRGGMVLASICFWLAVRRLGNPCYSSAKWPGRKWPSNGSVSSAVRGGHLTGLYRQYIL